MTSIDTLHSRHLVLISLSFVVWKAILGLVAYNSPGIGYDTSSSLLEHFGDLPDLIETPSTLQNSITKFIRWDAVYFTQIAARNYVFEQEWAFSFAFARIMSVISRGKLTFPRT
jgi:phosphatidylinositol glycan class V